MIYRVILFCSTFLAFGFTEKLPSLFVIGDSISIQYGEYLSSYLSGKFQYDRKYDDAGAAEKGVHKGSNGGDSKSVLEYLRARLEDPSFTPDVLLLNCGLHDIRWSPVDSSYQVNKNDYEKNLKEIIRLTKEADIDLIWVRSTAVVDSIHNKNVKPNTTRRFGKDLNAYNSIADKIMEDVGIPMIDLNSFTWKLGTSTFVDHVHYNQETRKLQAAFIAGFVDYIYRN